MSAGSLISLKSVENIRSEINSLVFQLFVQGLSYINETTLQSVDQLLHAVSQAKMFRVSVSLKYLKTELERHIKNSVDFDIDRLIFFISQTYLLSNGIYKIMSKNEPAMNEKLLKLIGFENTIIPQPKLEVRLVGVQSINIQALLIGFTFHFVILSGPHQSKIFTYDFFRTTNSAMQNDGLLNMKFNDLPFILEQFFLGDLALINCGIDPIKEKIYINSTTTLNNYQFHDPALFNYRKVFERYELKGLNQLIQYLDSIEIFPFETPFDNKTYAWIQEPNIVSYWKTEDQKLKSNIHFFELESRIGLKFRLRIDEKLSNKPLLENMQRLMKSNTNIDGMFGYLYFNENSIEIIPLYFSVNMQDFFPQITLYNPKIA